MELTLANVISNLLVLPIKSLYLDIENIFSSAHFPLQTCSNNFSTNWDGPCRKVEISNTRETVIQLSCNKETSSADEKRVQISEINMMMSRLGMADCLEDGGDCKSLGEKDFWALFDEEEPSLAEMREAFEVFDVNRDGFIDANELQRVVCQLGLKEGCNLEECQRMIEPFDSNRDGLIDFQEFVKFMEKRFC